MLHEKSVRFADIRTLPPNGFSSVHLRIRAGDQFYPTACKLPPKVIGRKWKCTAFKMLQGLVCDQEKIRAPLGIVAEERGNMPEITVYKDSKVLQEIKFTDFIKIGRRKSNDIVLESTRVSAVHASIIKTADGVYTLQDRSSRNGIEVGGELISHYPLSHGAVFRIAEYRLLFVDQPESQCTVNKVQLSGGFADDNKWEQDAQTAISMVDDLRKKPVASCDPQQRLSLILALSTELVSILDYHELMEKSLDMALEVMDAERGFLAIKNEQGELVYSCHPPK